MTGAGKHSIKRQMFVVFVGLMVCLLLVLMFINVRFLEPYYIQNKEKEFVRIYSQLCEAVEQDTWNDEAQMRDISYSAERSNISYLILDMENKRLSTNVHNDEYLMSQLYGYLLNQAQKSGTILVQTDSYQISQSRDPRNQTEYIEMWGTFDNGYQFLLRSPLESIQESAAIFNRFLIYIGSALIITCIILVWYFSKKLTDPILELATLSNHMARLDFDAKYTGRARNEIDELGDNFNRMSEKLENTISELKKANNNLQKDIEQKEKLEEMRNEFLGNVSHELKTPIALIQGYAEGLKEGVSADPQSREFYCEVIMDEASKMNQMVRNLLTLNQLEFGDEETVFERFDLTELIQGVLQSMEIFAQQNQAKVNFLTRDPVYVWADEWKVEQVVRNYVSNAYHHLGGDMVMEVRILTEGDRARVTVFNTGTPIPEKDLPHVWDKFYKVDKAHTREYGGNGIGLSIVKAIMESFHQEYGVRNYDNGVEFWFELGTGYF